MELWEILVPKANNDGEEYTVEYHNAWDKVVKEICGGLTIMRSAKGVWVGEEREYEERMIPVRIAVDKDDLRYILAFTKGYYNQEAVFAAKISEEVIIYK
jgi:hypothetical protein